MKNTIKIKIPTIDQIEFELIAEFEHIPVKGNAIASGDEDYDNEVEIGIIERLESGDVWAWAAVEVKGTYKGITASDYLGGCSYKDEKDFKQPGGYYDDMKSEVYRMIVEQLKALAND